MRDQVLHPLRAGVHLRRTGRGEEGLTGCSHPQFKFKKKTDFVDMMMSNRKVAGSIPAGVIGFFIDIKILPIALWPWDRLSL